MGWARMVAGAFGVRGKSELHRARVPGESRGGAGKLASTVQIGVRATAREQQRPGRRATAGVKRAILPAAISESAASRLLAEAGRREPSRRRRRGRPRKGPREMTIGNRTRLTLPPPYLYTVPIAQSAERLSVEQEVAGSCPARHPTKCGASAPHFLFSARFAYS